MPEILIYGNYMIINEELWGDPEYYVKGYKSTFKTIDEAINFIHGIIEREKEVVGGEIC